MQLTDDIEYALALHAIDWFHGEDMPWLANALVERGASSPSLCELAAWSAPSLSEASAELNRGLREEGIELPVRAAAVAVVVLGTLSRLADGTLDAVEGADLLSALHARAETPHGAEFWGLTSEWNDHPEARDEIESQMRVRASEILAELRASTG